MQHNFQLILLNRLFLTFKLVLSRPLPVVRIIAKFCFYKDAESTTNTSKSLDSSANVSSSSDPYIYEFTRVRIPAYATVSLVKESIIKLEPRYFALEPRQLAMSILSTVSSSDTAVTHECNLDASYDRKLLTECHENIRYRYENHLPIILVFWIANFPPPPLQLDLPSIPVEDAKIAPAPPTVSVPAPPKNVPTASNPESAITQPENSVDKNSQLPQESRSDQPPTSSFSDSISDIAVIEIDGVLVSDGDLEVLEGDDAEQVEEEEVVSSAPRTALVQLSALEIEPSTPPSPRSVQIDKPDAHMASTIYSQTSPSVISTSASEGLRASQRLSMRPFSFAPSSIASSGVKDAVRVSAKMALSSNRVTISDVLLEEQLWLKPDVLKEGWLAKRLKKGGKKEELRWFQLRLDHHLYYFKDDSPNSVPLGRIPLAISTMEIPPDGKLDSFHIYYSQRNKERSLILASDDKPTIVSWIDVINRTMRDAKETYSASITQEGYLQKKGLGLKTWNRRYFVLKDGALFHYMTSEDAKLRPDQPRGKISLEDCYVTVNSGLSSNLSASSSNIGGSLGAANAPSAPITSHIFRIHVSNETLLFMASSFSELQQWLSAINDERDCMRERAHLRDTLLDEPSSPSPTPQSVNTPCDFPSFNWSTLPVKKRSIPSVEIDLPFDDAISKHIDMENISSHVDTPQLRLIRHHHALVRASLVKRKAKYEIYDVLLAPLTRLAPSVPLPDLINVRFHFGESSVAVKCPIYASILEGTAMAIDLLIRRKIFPAHIRAEDFVVKLCGSRQYLLDMDTNFADVIHVREQLGRGRTFVEVMLHTKVAVIAEISNAHWAEQLVEQQFYNLPITAIESPAISKANPSQTAQSSSKTSIFTSDDPDSEDDLDQLLEQLVDIRRGPEENKAPSTLGEMKQRSKSSSSASSSMADLSPTKILRSLCAQTEEQCYSVSDVRGHPFAVRVVSLKNFSYAILESVVPQEAVDNAKPESRISFFIQATLFYGNRAIGDPVRTAKRLTPFFNQTLDLKVDCSQLAPEMRIGVTLYVNHASKDLPLAWLNVPVADYAGRIHRGSFEAGMWIQPKAAHPVGSCESDSARSLLLCLEFEKSPLPMVFLETTTLPPRFELCDPPIHPLRSPFKSEITVFRRAHPSKSFHPLLGDDSLFGMNTFNRIQEQQTKQPAIGSSRSRIFGPGGSPSSLVTRNASNPSIVLGARRSPQTSVGNESSSGPSSGFVPSTTRTDGTSTSPVAGNSREITPSTSPSPGDSIISASPVGSPSPTSDVALSENISSVSPPTPSSVLPIENSDGVQNSDALSRLNFVAARARKSFAVSMSPPVPAGKSLSEANSIASSSNTTNSKSNFAAALTTASYQPDPVPAMSTAPQPSPGISTISPNEDPKSPLANTIWSKTVASTNLVSFAQKVSPNLTTSRLIAHLQEIDRICKLDPLTPLSDTQKQLLWGYRKQLIEKPETFPKLFLAPNLLNVSQREELHRMVKTAPLMPPEMALQLLDHRYPDSHVRAYAVRCLVNFGDEELASFLLQLVQVLQYETHYLAPLASFLVERAILNPLLIGQGLLWHLQAELYRPETETKFGILMEAILLGLKPSLRSEFAAQIEFVAKMVELNDQLQTIAPSSRTAYLRKHLANFATSGPSPNKSGDSGPSSSAMSPAMPTSKASSPAPMSSSPPPGSATSDDNASLASSGASAASTPSTGWSSGHIKDDPNSAARLGLPPLPPPSPTRLVLPLSSAMVVKGVIVEKCKVMDSAAFPLWLSFESEDPFSEPISVLFKFGDDLRQDALTLQMFAIMDRLWKREGLDLKMSLYKCLPTGPSMGMIEVVPEAETTARIQKEAGGIMGAFKQTPLFNWLKSYNTEAAMLDDATENFTRSCAAYCVATYVIGVGDRHNDNIMVTKSGKLFHIDFAHFLGNIIKFGVYKRERAPFVLTPEFAYVMGGEKSTGFAHFKALACNIYNKLRKHSSTFISLFELMLFAGLSQLSSYDDIAYLKKSLLTGTSETDAFDNFGKLIDESLSTKSTQLNFAIHIFAHPD